MFILTMADGRKGEGLSVGVVCRVKYGEWVKGIVCGVWSVGTSLLRGSRGLLATCGLSGQVWRVGQGNWRRRVVCRVKFVAWVKRIVGGVWSVGSSMASGSRGLSAGVVCRVKFVAWVKRPVGGVWSVGTSMASESRELSTVCGLSGQVWRVGQENCWRRVVCRGEKGEWVKGIVGDVWSVGSSMASGSRELLTECGLSGQVWRVGQRNCRRSVVCRVKYGEWVKGIVGRVWSVGAKRASGSKELSTACGLSAQV